MIVLINTWELYYAVSGFVCLFIMLVLYLFPSGDKIDQDLLREAFDANKSSNTQYADIRQDNHDIYMRCPISYFAAIYMRICRCCFCDYILIFDVFCVNFHHFLGVY